MAKYEFAIQILEEELVDYQSNLEDAKKDLARAQSQVEHHSNRIKEIEYSLEALKNSEKKGK